MEEVSLAAFISRRARKKRRRVGSGGEDQRATALRVAGLELLSKSDFENISIARLAKEARCSIGAFYYRYPDKNAYLKQLISATFREIGTRLDDRLSISGSEKSSSIISLSEFLSPIISRLSRPENVGVIRAALKLGATEPEALRYYEEYREQVTAKVENTFKGASKKKIRSKEIREAIQLIFASINDAALMPKSAAMKLGSEEMTKALCAMAARHIGVKADYKGRIAKTIPIETNKPDQPPKATDSKTALNKKQPTRRQRRNIRVI